MFVNKNGCQKAFLLANSVFLFIFSAYVLDLISEILSVVYGGFSLIFIPLKVYLYSGLYGVMVDLVSREAIMLEYSSLHQNAKKFWRIYTLLLILCFFIQALLVAISPGHFLTSSSIFYRHISIVFSFLMIIGILHKKYPEKFKKPLRAIALSRENILVIIFLYLSEMFIFYQPQFISITNIFIQNILEIAAKYLHFLEFLYLTIIVLKQYPEIIEENDSSKELFLVYPKTCGNESPFSSTVFKRVMTFHPPFFVILKALTPKNYRIRKFNRILWRDEYFRGNKLVAITCFSSNSAEAYKVAKEFKKRGSKVVIGGPHVSFLPEEALEFCDSVVIGEAEGVWPQIIEDYENNCLKRTYSGGKIEECHEIVYQELLESAPEVIKDFLEVSRGCKYTCHFCTVPSISGSGVRTKPVFQLVELIKKIRHKYKRLIFIDNNIYNDPQYAKELFRQLKPLKIQWFANATLDMAKNEEVLQLAKESGCYMLLFGYEINDSSIEKNRGGKFGMVDKYLELTQKVHNAGIPFKATFILGWDSQNFRGLLDLWRYCLKLKPWVAIPFLLTPFPGTIVFENMLKEKRILSLNWKNYNQWHGVIKYKNFEGVILDRLFIVFCVISYCFGSRYFRKIAYIFGWAFVSIFVFFIVIMIGIVFYKFLLVQ